jgi:hypothetical protein
MGRKYVGGDWEAPFIGLTTSVKRPEDDAPNEPANVELEFTIDDEDSPVWVAATVGSASSAALDATTNQTALRRDSQFAPRLRALFAART